MAGRRRKNTSSKKDYFVSSVSLEDLKVLAQTDEPNSTRRVKGIMERHVLNRSEHTVLDLQERVWVIPETRDRYGKPTLYARCRQPDPGGTRKPRRPGAAQSASCS